jgi:hypothetical protein
MVNGFLLENKSTATTPRHIPVSAHHVLVPSKILTMHFGAQTVIGAGGDLILYKPYYGQQYIAEYFTSII